MATAEHLSTKMVMETEYTGGTKKSLTVNGIKPTATDTQLYGVATAINTLRTDPFSTLYKVVETELY
ncbi:MAG: DUF1659 domain-containing protein [Clostridiales bacterium]|jgi:hypothetical protein|nr:DUF1659 domain-containing protein [Clostridiales bacterium]